MEVIFNTIQNDLITLGMLMFILGSCMIVNLLLGSIIAWNFADFQTRKFWQGVLKCILVAICMAFFLLILEIIPLVTERIGIQIDSDLPTTLEVLLIGWVSITKYIADIYNKFKSIFNVTQEEIDPYKYEESEVKL